MKDNRKTWTTFKKYITRMREGEREWIEGDQSTEKQTKWKWQQYTYLECI